eukprot:827660-Rhodomonas_salina.4
MRWLHAWAGITDCKLGTFKVAEVQNSTYAPNFEINFKNLKTPFLGHFVFLFHFAEEGGGSPRCACEVDKGQADSGEDRGKRKQMWGDRVFRAENQRMTRAWQ